jgi:hypothetical protein
VLFWPLSGHICHLKWWLTKFLGDEMDIVHMSAQMGNDERTKMQLKFQDSWNPTVFTTTPNVGRTGPNLAAGNDVVTTPKFWVLNEQRKAFTRVVRLGQTRVPYTWWLNIGPGGYDNHASDLHKHSGVAHMRALHGLMSRPNIMTLMICRSLEASENHIMQLTKNGDTLQSDEPLILEC